MFSSVIHIIFKRKMMIMQAIYCEAIAMVEEYQQQGVSMANLGGIRDVQGSNSSPQVFLKIKLISPIMTSDFQFRTKNTLK